MLAIFSDPLLMPFVIMAKELRVEYRTYGREMAESFGFSGSIAIHEVEAMSEAVFQALRIEPLVPCHLMGPRRFERGAHHALPP